MIYTYGLNGAYDCITVALAKYDPLAIAHSILPSVPFSVYVLAAGALTPLEEITVNTFGFVPDDEDITVKRSQT